MKPVTIRARAAGQPELVGELPCWTEARPMEPVGGGVYEARVPLGPGVHEVKLRVGAGWAVDPGWRTITRGGETNGVIVVDGTPEPVLHAPAAPWLERADDGRVIVRAAVRRAHDDRRLSLRTADGARPMRRVGDDGDHALFELALPGAARSIAYAFVVPGHGTVGDASGADFEVDLRALPAPPPAWWRDAVVYTVLVDRFRRAGAAWDDPARSDRDHRAGGDLDGVIEALPHLVELGVTALHLTPLATSPSPHRYDAIDPRAVDPALGGEAALDRLLAATRAAGVRVLLDVAMTHVDRGFAPFAEVAARGPASPYWRWFQAHRWPFFDGPDPGYQHYQKGQWREPLLDLDQPEVADYWVETCAGWARRGVDGLRIDAAADVPAALIARVREAVRAARADAIVFGEVVPAQLDRWAPAALDAATDFAAREALVGWLTGATDGAEVAGVFARQRRRGAAARSLGFTGTHDQPRIRSVTGDPALARLGLVAVALGARVPLLYYGDEIGLGSGEVRDFEDSWPDRQPMPWDPAAWDPATRDVLRDALRRRRARAIWRRGDEEVVAHGPDRLRIRRTLNHEVVDLVLDRAARTWAIVEHAPPPDPELCAHNGVLAEQAFRDGHVLVPTFPRRLYLTVTEACNLRCRHCITDAPARTASGAARTLQPWLLDALDEAFDHAEQVCFTHGGESLSSPIFDEVLRRIGGRAPVHLVTNGTLLDEARLRRLLDLGVTSLMVSLDGATADVNDRIRVLGRFDRVIDHVAGAVRLRDALGADLRIGVSTVVGRTNLAGLPALGQRCVELGVDWLKVEETYPATPFARHDRIDPGAPALADAMAALRDALAGRPIVLVDHLDAPAACACSGGPAVAAFRAADDFANRATFRPCRAAWEQAAIDPDGTVHAIDYAQPALGNLLDSPLLALWNAPAAQRAREHALAACSREQRETCLAPDVPRPSS